VELNYPADYRPNTGLFTCEITHGSFCDDEVWSSVLKNYLTLEDIRKKILKLNLKFTGL
jgi:hypothetical protein